MFRSVQSVGSAGLYALQRQLSGNLDYILRGICSIVMVVVLVLIGAPAYAVTLKPLPEPRIVKTDVSKVDYKLVKDLCLKAGFHPKQVVCFCTGTRAEEIAAAIILGAKTPEDVSRMTGARTGCRVECIQPILRILKAAGIEPKPKPGRHAWYGITPLLFEIPREVREKYAKRGFYFDQDEQLFRKILKATEKV